MRSQLRARDLFLLSLTRLGSYRVTLNNAYACNCEGGAEVFGAWCCHIMFVLLRVFKVSLGDPVLQQVHWVNLELLEMHRRRAARERLLDALSGTTRPRALVVDSECRVCYAVCLEADTLAHCVVDYFFFFFFCEKSRFYPVLWMQFSSALPRVLARAASLSRHRQPVSALRANVYLTLTISCTLACK